MSDEVKATDNEIKQDAPAKKNAFIEFFANIDFKKIIGYTLTVTVLRIAALVVFFGMFIMAIVGAAQFGGAYTFFSEFFQICFFAIIIYAVTEIINRPKKKQ